MGKEFMKFVSLVVIVLSAIVMSGCQSLQAIDPMSNRELDALVRDNVVKMVKQPRASSVLNNNNLVKVELLPMKNNTRSYMNREWDTIKNTLEEVFLNYPNVEFYNVGDRRAGQQSINELNGEGLIKASQQKKAGEQFGSDYNIQVTISETQLNKEQSEYRMLIKWYERETQRPIAATSVYFEKQR